MVADFAREAAPDRSERPDQDKADEVEHFLRNTPPEQLHLSEFALYSLGIVLLRRKEYESREIEVPIV